MNRKEIAIKLVLSILVIAISSFSYNRIFKINENLEAAQKIESEPYLYHNLTNKNRFINRFGTIAYIFKDTKTAFNSKAIELSKEDKEWINNYRKNHSISKNDKTGLFEGKNLILILGESFCNDGIHPELTPTLYKMRQEGFYFDNYYAPIYQSATNDSEFIALTSNVPSIDFGTTSKEFGNNHFPFSLPHLFKNQGYKVNSFHSFIKSFYNREPFHESLGFSYLYDRDDLNIWRDNDFTDYINWSDDKDLFEKTMKKTDSNEHFFDFIISASGHLPYMDLREELYDNYDKSSQLEGIDSESAYYLAAQMKLDQGLERLIEILDEKGILEDTVICVFGDHYPYGISSDESLDYLFGDNTYGFEKYRVPFLIYNSEVKGETSHKLGSTFDIFPTLCNLFGLDASGAFITGNDLFSEQDGIVLFPDSSFITEDYYYDALSSDVVYFGNVVNYQDQLLLNEELFRHSQLMLKSDFFRE